MKYYKLFLCLLVIFSIPMAADVITPNLQKILDNSRSDEHIPVMISLKGNLHPETAIDTVGFRVSKKNAVRILQERARSKQKRILKDLEALESQNQASNIRAFWIVNAIAADLHREAVYKVAKFAEVTQLSSNAAVQMIHPQVVENPVSTRDVEQTNVQFVSADVVQDQDEGYFVTGFQVKVAVLDTGFSDLQTGAVNLDPNSTSFVASEPFVNDLNFHGTHVAGIIGSAEFGVAQDCTILAVKVLNQFGSGSFADVIAGIEFSVFEDADVMNLSLGAPPSAGTKDVEKAVANAAKLGIFMVIAAGNDGPGDKTINSPGNVKQAFTVGAIGHKDFPGVSSPGLPAVFSSRGPKGPDFCAPGVQIPSLALDPANDPLLVNGTSQATPHVAGIVALLIEAVDFLGISDKTINKISKVSAAEKFLIKEACNGPAVKNVTGGGHVDALSAINGLFKLDKVITIRDLEERKQRKLALLQQLGRR